MANNNKEKWAKSINARTAKKKSDLIEQFTRMPILHVALERLSVSRSAYYNWRDTDPEFKKSADAAIVEGEAFISDMSESQLVALIKDGHFQAVQLWLRSHHPKYSQKVELSGGLMIENEELSSEEEELLNRAIELLGVAKNAALTKSNDDHSAPPA